MTTTQTQPDTTGSSTDTSWFRGLGLGVFIHWGHASTRGWELSWQMTGGVHRQEPALDPVSCNDYFDNAAGFAPERFDPTVWADLAWRAGARYMVFTAKHHDGFAMFDTGLSDYSVTRHAPLGRDVTREIVEAFRARGFRIGLYFSIIDWHHPDYPRYTDETITKPYVVGSYPRVSPAKWDRYRAFMLGQLGELLTGYGDIDIVWLDGEFEHTEEEWRFDEIRAFIRERQPHALVNDRCLGHGDFTTPEQQLPMVPPQQPWETCLTMNSSWGHRPQDDTWKSPALLLHTLIEAVSMGGNLLLNVGPTGDGEFPHEAVERLEALAGWLEHNAESVQGTEPGLTLWQFHGPSTRRTRPDGTTRVYLHLVTRPYERVTVRGLRVSRVERVTLLDGDRDLPWRVQPRLKDVHSGTDDPTGELHIDIRGTELDPLCTVLAVDLRR
ncbi:alpha-L-fucosidase [Streptacidiphilus sp. MAP5-3]|uniref:alpha-L-fucosidase n=1 Tax=unclassified Streptacidiphilus TaxID=2643834 RepID=UPI0035149F20